LLAVLALAAIPRVQRDQRLTYLFFLGGLIFFHGRYMSFPPVSLVSFLPILSQQSPKHNNWLAVFCLVVIAAFGVEWLRRVDLRGARWLIGVVVVTLTSTILTVIGRRGGFTGIDASMAAVYLGVTLTLSLILLVAFWLARCAPTDAQAASIATAAVVGESSVYLLLGNGDLMILAVRIGICALVALCGVLAARRLLVPATVTGLVALGAYAWVVISPSDGLPQRVEVDAVPRYMAWLHQATGHEYRSFGIFPDYSSIAEIQDVEVVGPLATNEWVSFVDLVASPPIARNHRFGSTFALAQWYPLNEDYPKARPLFDWVGMRYIVLDKTVFGEHERRDHEYLLDPASGLRVAYEDDIVTIVESPTAQSKAYFTTQVCEATAETTLNRLRSNPAAIDDAVTVETDIGDRLPDAGSGSSLPVPLAEYRPNSLRVTFEAPAPGIFVVKDSYFPGWQATVNGRPAEVLRVNGMVRGVMVPTAGPYEVTMSYRPASLVNGAAIAAATGVLLLVLVVWDAVRRRRTSRPCGVQP
jgi:hypothetical protein